MLTVLHFSSQLCMVAVRFFHFFLNSVQCFVEKQGGRVRIRREGGERQRDGERDREGETERMERERETDRERQRHRERERQRRRERLVSFNSLKLRAHLPFPLIYEKHILYL